MGEPDTAAFLLSTLRLMFNSPGARKQLKTHFAYFSFSEDTLEKKKNHWHKKSHRLVHN